jgi:hypothetical protein
MTDGRLRDTELSGGAGETLVARRRLENEERVERRKRHGPRGPHPSLAAIRTADALTALDWHEKISCSMEKDRSPRASERCIEIS